MPEIRPFRALRYDAEVVGDLAQVVSPPYDVISPRLHEQLLARHQRNVVRLDLPREEPGDPPDEKYRRAARTFAAWRSDGTLRKDRRPGLYVYEQTYVVPGTRVVRSQRGFLGRLRLEPLGEGDILPHERTLPAPREDRYRLLRATGANLSPVVGLYSDTSGSAAGLIERASMGAPAIELRDEDVRHRIWIVPDADDSSELVSGLVARAADGQITIAEGHHRYEAALRYRDERRLSRSCEDDPAFDYILVLLVASSGDVTTLPTHQVVRGLGDDGRALRAASATLFDVQPVADARELLAAFGPAALAPGGRGRFGLWTRAGGAILKARRAAFEGLTQAGGAAVRGLDVTLLETALHRLCNIDAAAVAAGRRVAHTQSATEAIGWVDASQDGSDAAFLLEPTPVSSVMEVAAAGDLMPQESICFYPKALTGLILNPHEW